MRLRVSKLLTHLLISASTFISISALAQDGNVGIGTSKPDNSAILDISSDSKGLLIPRLNLSQRTNILNPAAGLMVYQTDFVSGLYIYDGTNWTLSNYGLKEAKLTTTDNTVWSTTGNIGLNSTINFIGTKDTSSLVFRVNDARSGLIDYRRGNTFLGYKAGFNSNGYNSVVMGSLAMQKPTLGGNNVTIGFQSMYGSESGDFNVAVGSGVLASNRIGEKNTSIGAMSGYKATGSGNIFIGYQSGYFETGNNKFIVNNNVSNTPLLFGDLASNQLSINSTDLGYSLTVNAKNPHSSGLRLQQLSSSSPVKVSTNRKVLSVNEAGEIILVTDDIGSEFWNASGNDIINNNTGLVSFRNNVAVLGNLTSPGVQVGVNGLKLNNIGITSVPNTRNQLLSVDDSGKVILVAQSATASSFWTASGNDLTNSNLGNIIIEKDLNVKNNSNVLGTITSNALRLTSGGIKFDGLNSASPSIANPTSKVLSLDANGNMILVNDLIGSGTTPTPSPTPTSDTNWALTGTNLSNTNTGDVTLNNNLTVTNKITSETINFKSLNSNSSASLANGKALSLDENGKVILVQNSTLPGTSGNSKWVEWSDHITPANPAKVVVIGSTVRSLPEGYSLYVGKGILAERVRVALASSDKWADYVFEKNYKLMPLNDVEKFIKANKHLPNVPSAEEFAKKGLDMAEVNAKLMEKIEELTLYMIEANKKIESLEKKVNKLK